MRNIYKNRIFVACLIGEDRLRIYLLSDKQECTDWHT